VHYLQGLDKYVNPQTVQYCSFIARFLYHQMLLKPKVLKSKEKSPVKLLLHMFFSQESHLKNV
jgi:hypothetical protein